jgi:endonuclease/exonuclease/phosphatase (EEP) superfamily protein YafD
MESIQPRRPATAPARRPGRAAGWVRVCSWLYLAVAVGLWALLYEADLWWPATVLMFSPRWPLLAPLLVLVPAAALWRRRSLPALAAAGAVVAGPVMGLCVPWGRVFAGPPAGMRLRVLTCNMHYYRVNPAPLDDLVFAAGPDVVALQEWAENNRSAIMVGKDWHVRRTPRLFLASRFPIGEVKEVGWHSVSDRGAVSRYDLRTPAGTVYFFSVHLASPRRELRDAVLEGGREDVQLNSDLRAEQSENLARAAAEAPGPVLLAGDFNTPPESVLFRRVWGRYADAFAAAGFGYGWTFYGSHTEVRIDHVLAGKGWRPTRCWVGPDVGSPHRPVLADLVWTGPGE